MLKTHTTVVAITVLLGACGNPALDPGESESNGLDVQEASVVCPGSTKVYGVDVSSYDGTINWSQVAAAGKQFAIIRVSDGTSYPDSKFTANWKGAKAAGLTVGAYQFFRPGGDPIAQADLMLSKLASVGFGVGDIPPVVDFETTDGVSNATALSNLYVWLDRINAKIGRRPVMYSSARVWSLIGNPSPSWLPYLWDAQWTTSCPNLPPPWGRLRFWQYSATGSVPGIGDAADLDLYNGSLTELRSL